MKPNSKLSNFLRNLPKAKVVKPAPKFTVGDVIINSKFKVISKVVDIRGMFETEDGEVCYDQATYVLEDVKNEAYEDFVNRHFQDPDTKRNLLKRVGDNVRRRHKLYSAIDFSYDKLDPKAAYILYGITQKD